MEKQKGLVDNNVTEDLTNKLNEDCLLKLFSFLPRNDIVTVQRVCHSWRASAQHKSLWNNYTLTLTNTPADEKNIILMPALRNIDGETQNHMLDVILSNVTDLKKLNCEFTPAISSTQAQDVLRKYPELESITVNKYPPDILETMNKLKSAGNLKEVIFGGRGVYFPLIHRSNSLKILEILADSLNFPALTTLHLTQFCSREFKDSAFLNLMADVIRKRSEHLLYLNYNNDTCTTILILNSITICTELRRLHLNMFDNHPLSFNLTDVTHLESLGIYSRVDYNVKCFKMVKDVFARRCWAHLEELIISFHCCEELDILKSIIENSEHLKILKYINDCYTYPTLNESQLERIGSLSKLEILEMKYFETMTQKGLDFLSGCRKLTYLSFSVISSNIDDFLLQVAKMVSHMTKLTTLKMRSDSLAIRNIHLQNQDEINNFLVTYLPV